MFINSINCRMGGGSFKTVICNYCNGRLSFPDFANNKTDALNKLNVGINLNKVWHRRTRRHTHETFFNGIFAALSFYISENCRTFAV